MKLALLALLLISRIYHPVSISDLAADDPHQWHKAATHIKVTGIVAYKLHEGDGDWHVRLCDDKKFIGAEMNYDHCIVAEFIAKIPLKIPKVGDEVTVCGISRFDAESPGHHWWEVQPVEEYC